MEMLNILNAPAYADDYEFVVVRELDGALWFWGAFEDGFKAEQVALEVGGLIVHNVRIQGKRR